MIRPGVRVVLLGGRGRGQVTRVDEGVCEVLWKNGSKRERVPEVELVWCGRRVRTRDGRAGRVIELGRSGGFRVRIAGECHWMTSDELVLCEQSEQSDVLAE
jgi:hypothetical protein